MLAGYRTVGCGVGRESRENEKRRAKLGEGRGSAMWFQPPDIIVSAIQACDDLGVAKGRVLFVLGRPDIMFRIII